MNVQGLLCRCSDCTTLDDDAMVACIRMHLTPLISCKGILEAEQGVTCSVTLLQCVVSLEPVRVEWLRVLIL